MPRPTQGHSITHTVETVEKVPFQKLFLKSGRETPKIALLFGLLHNILALFWLFFSLKTGINCGFKKREIKDLVRFGHDQTI